MEQRVRVQNEQNWKVLVWLRSRVGDAAVTAAEQACTRGDTKPCLSMVCRQLGLSVPRFARHGVSAGGVGERHLRQCMRFCARRRPVPTRVDDSNPKLARFGNVQRVFGRSIKLDDSYKRRVNNSNQIRGKPC
jgi:hypothetical protein